MRVSSLASFLATFSSNAAAGLLFKLIWSSVWLASGSPASRQSSSTFRSSECACSLPALMNPYTSGSWAALNTAKIARVTSSRVFPGGSGPCDGKSSKVIATSWACASRGHHNRANVRQVGSRRLYPVGHAQPIRVEFNAKASIEMILLQSHITALMSVQVEIQSRLLQEFQLFTQPGSFRSVRKNREPYGIIAAGKIFGSQITFLPLVLAETVEKYFRAISHCHGAQRGSQKQRQGPFPEGTGGQA